MHETAPDPIRTRLGEVEAALVRRNRREILGVGLVAVMCGAFAWGANGTLLRVGAVLLGLGAAFAGYNVRRSLRLEIKSGASSAAILRERLERQHRLLSQVWRWVLGPLVPGTAVMLIGAVLVEGGGQRAWLRIGIVIVCCVLSFVAVAAINDRAARALREEIDALADR